MNKFFLLIIVSVFGLVVTVQGQTCTPTAKYILADGEEADDASSGQSAPVKATFSANPSDYEGYSARFEWRIYDSNDTTNVLVHRFDEEIDYTFSKSGVYAVELTATFQSDDDLVTYSSREEGTTITVSISESRLEMPNAFSPGDDYNRYYRAKDNHQSIVQFRATIFNRWGQKLYSWNDVNGHWDGKVNGRYVKNGVYFVNVNAKGADGRVYHIRKDINVLTNYNQSEQGSGTDE